MLRPKRVTPVKNHGQTKPRLWPAVTPRLFPVVPITPTSPSGPGPRPRPKPRQHHAGLLVAGAAAAEARPQHGFHVLVLGDVLGVAQASKRLRLLAAARAAGASAGDVPAALMRGSESTRG